MFTSFVPNLILILALLGILAIFFRRIPDVLEHKDNEAAVNGAAGQAGTSGKTEEFNNQALLRVVWNSIENAFAAAGRKIWHFMLEAKDLKQSQIIAAKFSRLVTPKTRLQNIGALSSMKKAQRLALQGELDQAEKLYIEVIRKHPQEYQAYEGLLKIYLQQKKIDYAIEVLEFLTAHNPDQDAYLAQLGSVYLTGRRFNEAAEAYRRSIAINDLVPARFINLGLSLQGTGELEEALQHFQRAVDLEPANVQYLLIFADGLADSGNKKRAAELLRKGLQASPASAEISSRLKDIENPI